MRKDAPTPQNELSESEMSQLLALAKRALWGSEAVKRRLQAAKVNLIPANFYSSVPTLADLDASFEQRFASAGPYDSAQVFDRAQIESFLAELEPYAAEFDPAAIRDPERPELSFWDNGAFSGLDAIAYWSILRRFQPQRVTEIGSGYSTLVADAALRANGRGSQVLIEPYPKPWLQGLKTVETIHRRPVQNFDPEELAAIISSGEIWFIDSTHTVKIGSDCLMIYLLVMPRLQGPLLVHAHDVFLPFGFPPDKARDRHIYWTEQYLLYAYLLENPRARVLFGSQYCSRLLPAAAARLMPAGRPPGGGSLWFRLGARTG